MKRPSLFNFRIKCKREALPENDGRKVEDRRSFQCVYHASKLAYHKYLDLLAISDRRDIDVDLVCI